MFPFLVAVAALYGLVIGSFLNAVVYRVPRKESLNTRSHCPRCNRMIRAWDNIPVLSWLLLRGKCRDCGLPIHWRYPAVELAGAASFAGVVAYFAPRLDMPLAAAGLAIFGLLWLVASSIALALIDFEHKLLPNAIVYPTLAVVVVSLGMASLLAGEPAQLLRGLAGMVALGLFYGLIWFWKPGAMGFGDVRLSWVLGFVLAWFSWSALLVGAFAAFLLGGLVGVALLLAGTKGRKAEVPFGPWMVAGAWLAIFAGAPLIDMYLQLGGLR